MTTLDSGERRDSKRVPYPAQLFVAEYDGKEYPDPLSFSTAEGHDLSTTGIGFFWPRSAEPDSMLVIRAGIDRPLLVTARVVHCQEKRSDDEQPRYLIGCEFVSRIEAKG